MCSAPFCLSPLLFPSMSLSFSLSLCSYTAHPSFVFLCVSLACGLEPSSLRCFSPPHSHTAEQATSAVAMLLSCRASWIFLLSLFAGSSCHTHAGRSSCGIRSCLARLFVLLSHVVLWVHFFLASLSPSLLLLPFYLSTTPLLLMIDGRDNEPGGRVLTESSASRVKGETLLFFAVGIISPISLRRAMLLIVGKKRNRER